MRAAIIRRNGGPDVVHVDEMPDPRPAPGEVVVKVLCAGLNHLDIWVRKGRPGTSLKGPHVLGSDAVGIVEVVGDNVVAPKVGDEVVINPALSCGQCEFCARGDHSVCPSFGLMGLSRAGDVRSEGGGPGVQRVSQASTPEHRTSRDIVFGRRHGLADAHDAGPSPARGMCAHSRHRRRGGVVCIAVG